MELEEGGLAGAKDLLLGLVWSWGRLVSSIRRYFAGLWNGNSSWSSLGLVWSGLVSGLDRWFNLPSQYCRTHGSNGWDSFDRTSTGDVLRIKSMMLFPYYLPTPLSELAVRVTCVTCDFLGTCCRALWQAVFIPLHLSVPIATKHRPRLCPAASFCPDRCAAFEPALQPAQTIPVPEITVHCRFTPLSLQKQSFFAVSACSDRITAECPSSVCRKQKKSGSISGAVHSTLPRSRKVHPANTKVSSTRDMGDLHWSIDITMAGIYDL